ncbi:hypothetical protein [Clostridium beijerinckii]|nr:hypothetical protein [Clostridium beijerinckii]
MYILKLLILAIKVLVFKYYGVDLVQNYMEIIFPIREKHNRLKRNYVKI